MTAAPDPAGLSAVRRAARSRANADALLELRVRSAHAAGHSLRAIAEAAGISHTQVSNIVRRREG